MSGGVLLPAVSIGLLATDNQEETPHMDNHNVVAIQTPSTDTLTQVLREGAQRLLAQAIQAEVEEFLECHADRRTEDGRAGVTRSGHQPARELQTGIGPVRVRIPKVRSRVGDPVTFRSSLVPPYVRKTRSLEAALPWLYLKGISTGDMSDALEALVGPEARGLSATTVSRLKRRWSEEYTTWRQTSLADRTWVYVWADGVYNRLRGESGKLCVLVVIGVDDRGRKHLLAVDPGLRESSQSWREVLTNLTSRGMDAPRLAIGDGAMGFWNAVSELWPETRHQRCWMHKTGNVLNRLPKSSQSNAKKALHDIWQAETRSQAVRAFDTFVSVYEAKFPDAVECLVKDREPLMTFYDFPAEHWKSIRTTNPIESTFGTLRHRTRRAKGCQSRESALHMIFKLGSVAQSRWRRLRGFTRLAEVVAGVPFKDGLRIDQKEEETRVAA